VARRRRARIAAWLALGALALAAALALSLPRALEAAAQWGARGTPLAPLALRVARVGWGEIELRDVRAGDETRASLAIERARLLWSPAGLGALRLDRAELDGVTLRADPASLAGAERAGAPAGLEALPLAAARVASGRIELAGLPPVSFDGELESEDRRIRFRATARAAARDALRVEVAGEHDLAAGSGEARVAIEPLRFAQGGLQPADLWPPAAAASRVVGDVEVSGLARWSPGALDTPFDVAVRGLGFAVGEIAVEGLDAKLHLERLWPPVTAAHQRVSVARVEAGAPLERGVLVFGLDAAGRLAIDELGFELLGGSVRTRGALSPRDRTHRLSWRVDLDLARLLEALAIEGLAGEGRVAGEVPVEVRGQVAQIREGRLAATGPGWIRYRPAAGHSPLPQVQGVDLLESVLKNFRFETLEATVNGDMDDVALALRLRGANPDVYGGHPIEFNLNLEYPPRAFLRSLTLFSEVSQSIARILRTGDGE
jgi:hypothetical protein